MKGIDNKNKPKYGNVQKKQILQYFQQNNELKSSQIKDVFNQYPHSLISVNTIENYLYEKTNCFHQISLSKLKEMKIIDQNEEIHEIIPTIEDIEEIQIALEEKISELPKEMILSLEEIGFQLLSFQSTFKTLSINLNVFDQFNQKKKELYLTRDVKQSNSIICCNGLNQLLKPMTNLINKKDNIEIECFEYCHPTNNKTNNSNTDQTTRNFYTKNDFSQWVHEILLPYVREIQKKMNTRKKCLLIMDEYFEQLMKGINLLGIEPFYLRKSTSKQLNPINKLIIPVINYLKQEFQQSNPISPDQQLIKTVSIDSLIKEKKLLKGIIEYSKEVEGKDISYHSLPYQPKDSTSLSIPNKSNSLKTNSSNISFQKNQMKSNQQKICITRSNSLNKTNSIEIIKDLPLSTNINQQNKQMNNTIQDLPPPIESKSLQSKQQTIIKQQSLSDEMIKCEDLELYTENYISDQQYNETSIHNTDATESQLFQNQENEINDNEIESNPINEAQQQNDEYSFISQQQNQFIQPHSMNNYSSQMNEIDEIKQFLQKKMNNNEIITKDYVIKKYSQLSNNMIFQNVLTKEYYEQQVTVDEYYQKDFLFDQQNEDVLQFIQQISILKKIPKSHIIFFDLIGWQLYPQLHVISLIKSSNVEYTQFTDNNMKKRITRDSLPSQLILGINGNGELINPQLRLSNENYFDSSNNYSFTILNNLMNNTIEMITEDDIINWIQTTSNQIHQISMTSINKQERYLILHEYFKPIIERNIKTKRINLQDLYIHPIYIQNQFYSIVPYSQIMEKTILNLLHKKSLEIIHSPIHLLQNIIEIIINQNEMNDCFEQWNELREKQTISSIHVLQYLQNNIEIYRQPMFMTSFQHNSCFNCFNLSKIPSFYRKFIYSIIHSKQFQQLTSKENQFQYLSDLEKEFSIPFTSIIVDESNDMELRKRLFF